MQIDGESFWYPNTLQSFFLIRVGKGGEEYFFCLQKIRMWLSGMDCPVGGLSFLQYRSDLFCYFVKHVSGNRLQCLGPDSAVLCNNGKELHQVLLGGHINYHHEFILAKRVLQRDHFSPGRFDDLFCLLVPIFNAVKFLKRSTLQFPKRNRDCHG